MSIYVLCQLELSNLLLANAHWHSPLLSFLAKVSINVLSALCAAAMLAICVPVHEPTRRQIAIKFPERFSFDCDFNWTEWRSRHSVWTLQRFFNYLLLGSPCPCGFTNCHHFVHACAADTFPNALDIAVETKYKLIAIIPASNRFRATFFRTNRVAMGKTDTV